MFVAAVNTVSLHVVKEAHSGSKTISLQKTKTLQTMVELATFLTLQPGQTEVGMWGLKSGIQAVT